MSYDAFKFGALALDLNIHCVPEYDIRVGIFPPHYDGHAGISIFATWESSEKITWIKPNGLNLLVADRVLLSSLSWNTLEKQGFVEGRQIFIDGHYFRCRLLQVGDGPGTPNEWDEILDITGIENPLWHWNQMYFWGTSMTKENTLGHALRGYYDARTWGSFGASARDVAIGFRPVLEPLGPNSIALKRKLDGIDFLLSSLPGGDGFCPVLKPVKENVFTDIPNGSQIKMYSFLEGSRPVTIDERIEDPTKLTLTDRYFGDEYLIPWVVSNGIAVASRILFRRESRG